MESVPLHDISNQSVGFTDGARSILVRLHLFRDMLYADVSVDDDPVVSGVRCLPGRWLMPFDAVNPAGGNFRFDCETDDYPSRPGFMGGTCTLRYYTRDEIAGLEGLP